MLICEFQGTGDRASTPTTGLTVSSAPATMPTITLNPPVIPPPVLPNIPGFSARMPGSVPGTMAIPMIPTGMQQPPVTCIKSPCTLALPQTGTPTVMPGSRGFSPPGPDVPIVPLPEPQYSPPVEPSPPPSLYPPGSIYRFNVRRGVYVIYVPVATGLGYALTLQGEPVPPAGTTKSGESVTPPTDPNVQNGGEEDRPLLRTWWFWAATGVAVAAATGTVVYVRRQRSPRW